MDCVQCPFLDDHCWLICPYFHEDVDKEKPSSSVFDFDHD